MIWDMVLVFTVMTLFSSGDLLNANYRIFFYVPFLSMLVLTSELNAKTSLLLYTFCTFARSWLGVIMSDRVFFTIYYYPESIYKDKIYEYNEKSGAEYELRSAVGYAEYSGRIEDFQNAIKTADAELYEDKHWVELDLTKD